METFTTVLLAVMLLGFALLVLGVYLGDPWRNEGRGPSRHRAHGNPYSADDAGWCPA